MMKFAVLTVMNVNFSETEHEKYRRLYPARWEVIMLHSHQLLHRSAFFFFYLNSHIWWTSTNSVDVNIVGKDAAITISSNASKPVATETHLQRKC